MRQIFLFQLIICVNSSAFSQITWEKTLNTAAGGPPNLGTSYNAALNIYTNSLHRAYFSTNSGLYGLNGTGDGLRIIRNALTAPPGYGEIDIFTSTSYGTEIRWGISGNIAGRTNRFEIWGQLDGLFYNTPDGVHKFARSGVIYGHLGKSNNWLLGEQTDSPGTGLDGLRRLHVFDRSEQLRLSYGGADSPYGLYTDFLSNSNGNLQILPSGRRVGINTNFDPQATIDVDGDARIRNVQVANPFCLLIGINNNAAIPQDVNVRRLDFTTNPNDVLLGNGTFGPIPGMGAACGSAASAGALGSDSRINLDNHNFYFSNYAAAPNAASNRVAVGYNCSTPLTAKFNVYQQESSSLGFNTTSGYFENRDQGTISGLRFIGVHSIAHGIQTVEEIENVGGLFIGMDTHWNIGVRGVATPGAYNNTSGNINSASVGGDFSAYTGLVAINGYSAYGVRTTAYSATNNYGIRASAFGGSNAYGIYAEASGATNTLAGYFVGNVLGTGTATWLSDQQFKTDVSSISNGLESLLQLHPVTYLMDTASHPEFNLDSHTQFGFLAQEVAAVFPNLVYDNEMPAQYDTLGNETSPAVSFKSLNYNGLIPINTQAIIELNQKVESKDSIIDAQQSAIDDLNARLTSLENCLSALLPSLCQMNQSLIQNNSNEQQEQVRKNLAVTLNDRTAIVLDQNIPNPFAEQTVINFSIPATVQKAQIHFYDGNGKLIQSVDVTERGLGSLTVFGSDLSSGTYTYTLVADGQIVATKKMMKQ